MIFLLSRNEGSGRPTLICFLAFLSSFTPLSTDLYLPALPMMGDVFHVSCQTANLSISLFMLFFAVSMPFWGPQSDRHGRKPVLFVGAALYTVGSVGCAMTDDITVFITCRCLQAFGGGALGTVSMAVVKDLFHGKVMENMLTGIQVVTVLAPMTAPILGGLILKYMSWRALFFFLAGCGAIGFVGTALMDETHPALEACDASGSTARLKRVLGDPTFRYLVLVFSLPTMSFMSYLTSSSYAYVTIFEMTPQMFSLYFSCIAGASVVGPLLYIRFLHDIPKRKLFSAMFMLLSMDGLFILAFGLIGPVTFTVLCMVMAMITGAMRPPATVILMNTRKNDSGTLSALIGCIALLFGSTGMLMCSLPFPDSITAVGSIVSVPSLAGLMFWRRYVAGRRTGRQVIE